MTRRLVAAAAVAVVVLASGIGGWLLWMGRSPFRRAAATTPEAGTARAQTASTTDPGATGGARLQWTLAGHTAPPVSLAVSRDGTRLVYFQPDGNPQIWSVPIEADSGGLKAGKPERFLATKYFDQDGSFSPDGRWLAYASNESGRFEVYVRAFAASGSAGVERWPISNSGGLSPAWSPNGRELLYRAGDQIMTVGYTVRGDSFVAERPRVWAANVRGAGGFDLAPDGKRVAMFVPLATKDASQRENAVVVVLNFFDELRRRAPTGQ